MNSVEWKDSVGGEDRSEEPRKLNGRGKHMKSLKMQSANGPAVKSCAVGHLGVLLAIGLAIGAPGPSAQDAHSFTVDTSQSRVAISGNIMGAPVHEQGPGSLLAQYGGTIVATVSGNSIQFPGDSRVVATISGDWQPLSDGNPGSEPANYGGTASDFSSTGVAAVRDVEVDVASGTLALVDGMFDTQGITLSIPESAPTSIAYRVQGFFDDSGVAALGGARASGQSAQGSLTNVGGEQVLTLPINYRFYFSLMSPNDTAVSLTGLLVATRRL